MKALLPFQTSDAALVRRALRDDSGAFEDLVRRHQRKAHGLARALGVAPDTVDDVVQEAFLQAFRDLSGLRSADSFGPWLLGIVRNVSLKAVRKARRTAATPLLDALDGAAAEDSLEGEDFREYLWRKVGELPEGVREALFLYYHDGESVREVARALGVSRAVVKNRLKKGRDILRERLWRRLEECLRDMLPSTREWEQKARRLALVAAAAAPAAWALGAGTAAAAAPTTSGAAAPAAGSALIKSAAAASASASVGGLIMTKKVIIPAAVAALALGTALIITTRGFRGDAPPGGDLLASRDASLAGADLERSGAARSAADRTDGEAGATLRARDGAGAQGAVSLRGRVVDAEGRGISGARLVALRLESWDAIGRAYRDASLQYTVQSTDLKRLREDYLRFGEAAPAALSGDDGAYAFRGLPDGDHRIVASHEDFLPSVASVAAVGAGAGAVPDIELVPAQAIAGKVLDEDGSPVAGAVVRPEPSRASVVQGTERVSRLAAAWEEGRILVEVRAAETAADGSFRIAPLEPDLHDLSAAAEGYAGARAWNVPAGTDDVVLTLERGAAVIGRVLDAAGSPAAAEVILSRAKPAEVHRIFDQRHAEIDLHGDGTRRASIAGEKDGGRFRIEGVEAGAYTLRVRSGSLPAIAREVEVGGGDADLGDLILEEPRAISGVVRAPGGMPIEGARVWVPGLERRATPTNRLSPDEAEPLAETASGAGGRFTLSGLPGGALEVRASSEGFADGAAAVAVGSSGSLDVLLATGSTLAGRVVDEETGSPVEGARVKVGFREPKETSSDAEGRFAIRGIPPSALHHGQGWVNVSHPDYSPHARDAMVLGRDERSPIEVRLSRGGKIAGWVLGPEREPVRGARVWFEVEGLPSDALGYNPARGLTALSAEDGSFTIPGPSQLRGMIGDIRLFAAASHPSRAPGRAGPIAFPRTGERWQEVEIVLSRGIVIEGKVADSNGRPVAGARVTARARTAAGWTDPTSPEAAGSARPAFSGRDGSYRIRGAPPETSEIRARALGHAPAVIPASPAPGEGATRVDIVLDPGAPIEGRVVDSSGAPVPGVEVEAFPEGELPGEEIDDASEFSGRMARWSAIGLASARTGPDGAFRLGHLPDASFTLLARAAGFEPETAKGVRPGGAAAEIVLGRYSAIRGAVIDAGARAPVTSFQVEVINKAKRDALVTSTGMSAQHLGTEGELRFIDPAGRFLYDGLRPGKYEVIVVAPGFLPRVLDAVVQAGEELALEVPLERGARVEGVVVDAESGGPVAGAAVHAWVQPRPAPGSSLGSTGATSREDGSFVLEGLADGKYAFGAQHPLYALEGLPGRERLEREVARGAPARIEIRLRPAGGIEGTIRGLARERTGNRELRHWLVISPAEDPTTLPGEERLAKEERDPVASWRNHIYLDPSGSFHQSNILPGRYRIDLKRQPVEEGEHVSIGPMGGFGTSNPAGPEETFPLGEVEIEAGRVATFEAEVPAKP